MRDDFDRLVFGVLGKLYPWATAQDVGRWVEEDLEARDQSFIFKTPRGRIVTPMPEAPRERAIEIAKRHTALGEASVRTAGLRTETGEPLSEQEHMHALRRAYYKIMDDPLPVAIERRDAWVKRAWYARKHGAQAKRKFEQWAGELKRWLVIVVSSAEDDPEVTLVTDTGGFKSAYYEPPSPEDVVLGEAGDNIEDWMDLLTPAEHRAIERELNGEQQPNVAGRMALSRARRKLYLAMEAQQAAQRNP
jgi:hypothetical protein